LNMGDIYVEPDSLLINYTDGLMDHEHSNPNWTEESLIAFIETHGNETPDGFNQRIMNHINHVIKGKPIDDVTLLTLRIF
jgi:sigma-B regulation protein RsbU (phosphoserine phosphatase)